MDRDELDMVVTDWADRLRAIATEMQSLVENQVLGDHGDEQVTDMADTLQDVAGDLGRLL